MTKTNNFICLIKGHDPEYMWVSNDNDVFEGKCQYCDQEVCWDGHYNTVWELKIT